VEFRLPLSREPLLSQVEPNAITLFKGDFFPIFIGKPLVLPYLPFYVILDLSMQVSDHHSTLFSILSSPCLMSGKRRRSRSVRGLNPIDKLKGR